MSDNTDGPDPDAVDAGAGSTGQPLPAGPELARAALDAALARQR
ncbi:MAG: hypothetical protein QOI74_1323, partial [Micromonosporaceae bacterium]|nr:hypothetical protein [Micromonosporaceae bacterium]